LIAWRPFAVAGLFFGLSYVCLFAAYYRARVTVVSPLVATESLWGVRLSVLLFKRPAARRRRDPRRRRRHPDLGFPLG
jgi:drug/metabolite transporter (DMT)-like permease